ELHHQGITMADKILAPMPRKNWQCLHRLMMAQRFPAVPADYAEAEPYFARVRIYGLKQGRKLLAAFIFGPPQEGVSFLDVVCDPGYHGLWATPATLQQLYHLAFVQMGLRVVWVQPRRKAGLKAALQAGFMPGTPLQCGSPVLVMTPFGVPPRYRKNLP